MCRALKVSESGYYDWQKRKKSTRLRFKEALKDKIGELFYEKHGEMAGSHLITHDLHDFDEFKHVNRTRIALLMKEMGLKCKIQKKYVVTTDSKHNEWISENLLARDFNPSMPNTVIAGDITYLRVSSHWVYLSIFMDLYSRKIVGWDLSESLAAESTCKAFRKYLFKYGEEDGLLVHSDRGIQYASKEFRQILESINAEQSMSRKGNCWDNAVVESFFHTLKTRLTHHRRYKSLEELNRDIYWYIEIYYTRVRKHSANNWLTPEQMESNYYNSINIVA
jgi:putative transposase